jgi:bifunctional N-acetylglucosamine-1-phosphate-uridyltransferase/glucosamine-1-phosphate-acetyltransferase GlmU-like protein
MICEGLKVLLPLAEVVPNSKCCAILLCGGKGSRLASQGIDTHKPLMPLLGKPSLLCVIDQLCASEIDFSSIIVVVPTDRIEQYQIATSGREIIIVGQSTALGTGDAVIQAIGSIPAEIEHVYVSFGTQPLVRNHSIWLSLAHHIANNLAFTLPTTLIANPYAPLIRDENGVVCDSIETHLEASKKLEFGEANVGGYWASIKALREVLYPMSSTRWNAKSSCYDTASGELGYPNEMVRACLAAGLGVDGLQCAEPEEMMGIKTLKNIGEIEEILLRRQRQD